MEGEIVNRVASSKLVTIDLEDFYPSGQRVVIDLKDWLFEGLILREKEFRAAVQAHDWSSYEGKYVAITCSNEAIIPSWANLLISISLSRRKRLSLSVFSRVNCSLSFSILSAAAFSVFAIASLCIPAPS